MTMQELEQFILDKFQDTRDHDVVGDALADLVFSKVVTLAMVLEAVKNTSSRMAEIAS